MYNYNNLWVTMQRRGVTKYSLRIHYGIPKSTLDRLKNNKNVEIYTLDKLCSILNCNFSDIVDYVPDNSSGKK
ncbi:MAG: helix-turn-helix transcriptional regulator [Eubacteriales bacterium]|nr:helix-turn-helix transcriptional regulator [Eubacteriales bacterium]